MINKINSKTSLSFITSHFIVLIILLLPSFFFAQTPCFNGMANGYPCNQVDLLGHLSYGSTGATDIWGWKSPNTGDEYAIMGLVNGVTMVKITDPTNPVEMVKVPIPSSNSNWTDIKVKGNYAYVVTEANTHHIRVFDLTRLDDITNPPLTTSYETTFGMVGDGSAHNIVTNRELDYSITVGAGEASGGLIFHDLSNPLEPTKIGQFHQDGYSHDAVCFVYRGEDVEHVGKEICIGLNTDTYTIVDVTDKSNPIQLSRTPYAGSRYTHQGWVTDDQKFLFLNDELDELQEEGVNNTTTFIFDISDLDNPSSTPYHKFISTAMSIDHNLYVKGSYVYQANYSAGLRILDISNLEEGVGDDKVTEAAYFDVHPPDNNTSFNGSWSVYPYFKSGNVVVSSRQRGLFVVRPQLEHFVMDVTSETVQTINQNGEATYNLDITAYAGFDDVVNLSVSNAHEELEVSFNQNDFVPSGMTKLDIQDNGLTPNGKYSLEIVGTTTNPDIPTQKLRIGLIVNSPVLPVSWLDFSAKAQLESIQLDWSTASETGNKSFEIERSTHAKKDFNKIAWVAGKGTTSNDSYYQFQDETAQIGQTYYYRLRQVDTDGQVTFSKIVAARIANKETTLVLTPNPAKDFVQVQISSEPIQSTATRIEIMSLEGKIIQAYHKTLLNYTFNLPLDNLDAGVYILRLQVGQEILTERLIVQ